MAKKLRLTNFPSVNKVNFESVMGDIIKDIGKAELKSRRKAALYLKNKVKKKALSRKKTGNLAKGVYKVDGANSSYIGIRAPGHQAYILEYGQGNLKKPHPSVYNTFAEEAGAVEQIMSEPLI